MAKPDITPQRLREILHYNRKTGIFTWRKRICDKMIIGSVAGSLIKKSYCFIRIYGRLYRAHRLAWLYVFGKWPLNDIDHIDHNRHRNAISNLRDVTRKTNAQNRHIPQSNGSSGYLGVTKDKKSWHMQIKLPDGTKIRKNYPTKKKAYAAYIAAKRIHHEGNTL